LALFGRILQGAMAVCDAIFCARSPIGIRVVANTPDLRSLINGCTAKRTVALERAILKRKKVSEPYV
jgi:hypothetical protein